LSGWSVWSRWINVNNGKEFVCVDNANGAAVWKETTAASGSGLASTEINTIAKLNAIVGDATLDTSSATRTPTAHNHAASEITSGTLPPARLGADSIDAITEIHTTLKTGADIKLVTGTNGTNGNLAAWNADGDLVDGGTTATPTAHTHAATDITETADAKVMTGVERTKLDGIEADATADQTAAQIETAYNSQVTIVSLVDAVAGTATVAGRWTPQRVAQAIAALAGDVRHVQTKEITIEDPIATEDVAMFYSHTAITISRLTIILVGSGSPSVTVDIRHHTDRSNAGTALITTPSATTSTTGGNKITVFNNPAVGAGSFVRCKTTAQGGTVTEMMVTIEYIED
jgi:hypothetical protein